MRYIRRTAAVAAALMIVTFPALAQTTGTPAPTPTTEPSPAGPLPDANGQASGPTREMIRQMIEQAVQERMQQERDSAVVGRQDAQGDRWQKHRDRGPDQGRRMAEHPGARMMRGAGMRLMFALLDTDGDGALSENEVQDTVGRIFNAIDQNGDGKIDLDEIQAFLHGSTTDEMP
ncbi:MAG: EF-hand domain-containing protein [Mesorhizobium sp.]|uniref:EF-hand domain-containing protein n=1 Tax=Mesorhizobium sp. TaxID=1871066 RepID=UPI000FE5424E|nr:EF-hand domain-containing protein [Mesorhizobium sp.]RWB70429.1 MAG: EF-hand domain-containing protein [Mesorhizobium sp.]